MVLGSWSSHRYSQSLSHTGHLNHPTTEGHGARVQETWDPGPAQPFTSYVTLVNSLFFSEPWFSCWIRIATPAIVTGGLRGADGNCWWAIGLLVFWPASSPRPGTDPGLVPQCQGTMSTPSHGKPPPPPKKTCCWSVCNRGKRKALEPERLCHSSAVADWLPLLSICKVGNIASLVR